MSTKAIPIDTTHRIAIVSTRGDDGVAILAEECNDAGEWIPDYEQKTFVPYAVLDDVLDAVRAMAQEMRAR